VSFSHMILIKSLTLMVVPNRNGPAYTGTCYCAKDIELIVLVH